MFLAKRIERCTKYPTRSSWQRVCVGIWIDSLGHHQASISRHPLLPKTCSSLKMIKVAGTMVVQTFRAFKVL